MPLSRSLLLVALSFCCYLLPVIAAADHNLQHEPQEGGNNSVTARRKQAQKEPQEPQQRQRRTSQIENRIVGGNVVTNPNQYPYFLEWEDAKCGASLIHDDIALSAAHCENDAHPFDMRVFMLGVASETGLFRTIERQMAHPLYSGERQDYDFLLLKLSSSALVDETTGAPTGAATISLNRDPNVPAVGDTLLGVGYGKLDPDSQETSELLNDVEIEYIPDETCLDQYGEDDFVQAIMFCAGVEGGGRDTCQGDSGGPIIHPATGTQVGAVSFGIGCAQADYAGVNARVSAVTEWIDDMVCELSDNPPARCSNSGPNNVLPRGAGQLSVHITYDDYPEETAWSMTYLGPTPTSPTDLGATNVNPTGTQGDYDNHIAIYLEPFQRADQVADRETIIRSFDNLPAGRYSFQFGDSAGDGLCCSDGNGGFQIINDASGEVVWENDGQFGTYVEAVLDINAAGALSLVGEDYDYDNSWEAFTAVNHPPTYDQEWPGAMPSTTTSAVMVNVKFDENPSETTWQFFSANAAGDDWELKDAISSRTGVANDLLSVEIDNLSAGWHKFTIEDTGGNGVCCTNRRGWVSLTAPIITTRMVGLAWGNNGEFGAQIDVYLNIDSEGFVGQVSYTDPLDGTASTSRAAVRRRKTDDENRDRQRQLAPFTDLPKQ